MLRSDHCFQRIAKIRLGHRAICPGLEHAIQKLRLGAVQGLFLDFDARCQRVLLIHVGVIPLRPGLAGCWAVATSARCDNQAWRWHNHGHMQG